MKKINSLQPGKLEEVAIIVFFVLFFILTVVAESTGQVSANPTAKNFIMTRKN